MRLLRQRHDHDAGRAVRTEPQADEQTIKKELAYNLCRCGTHIEILHAAERARDLLAARRQA